MLKAKAKKATPEGVDKLFKLRESIGEEEYTRYWRRLNKARRKSEDAFNRESEVIHQELLAVKDIFRASDFGGSVTKAKRAAIIRASDEGGRVIRRNAKGRFSKRGKIFRVIGKKVQ